MLEKNLYILLFVGAIFTVHLVSWVGSVLHSVPNGGDSSYAVFTFRTDQNKSMSTNIFMNILIPNVCLVFIYMGLYHLHIKCNFSELYYYVLFYYAYRAILICFILKRRELFNIKYEAFNSIFGILIAYFLVKKFLVNSEHVFIDLEELVNEFWLLIILIIYRFIVLLLDKAFCQKKVVNQKMLAKYIKNKFDYFFRKYRAEITITKEDKTVWILLFSIMIFENYNRGGILRQIERLKISFGKQATAGIMQISTNKDISDVESIALAYKKLKNEIMAENIDIDDEMEIEYYAYQYNPDEDYSKSVSFIYSTLHSYIHDSYRYREIFYMDDASGEEIDTSYVQLENENTENDQLYKTQEMEYWTFDDIVQMSGLTKKQVRKKIKKKNVTLYMDDKEVQRVFKKHIPKG